MKNLKLTVARLSLFIVPVLGFTLHTGCEAATQPPRAEAAIEAQPVPASQPMAISEPPKSATFDAATILARPEVPVLCYHQIRDYRATDSKTSKVYIVPPARFSEQMQALADSGYTTILPSDLYDYLTTGKALPERPVMITFDDSREGQVTAALPELNRHGFKGVFFIMTVALNKPGYMSREQVKQLSDEGHSIGSHTYDHKNVKTYSPDDWVDQVQRPSSQLQTITGKPVEYFAYPFGLWNKEAIAKLKDHDFKAVFQLAEKRDDNDPLHSIRRIIVPDWSGPSLIRAMKRSFK